MDYLSLLGRAPGNYIGSPGDAQAPAGPVDIGALLSGMFPPSGKKGAPGAAPRGLTTADTVGLAGGWARNLADAGDPDGRGSRDHIGEVMGEINARRASQDTQDAATRRAKLAPLLFPNDPQAQYLFATGDPKFTDAVSKQYEPATLSPGETRVGPDGKEVAHVAAKKTPLNTSRGLYEYDPETGDTRTLKEFPPEGPKAPMGYQFGPDGLMHFIPGGPADPSVIAGNALKRRRVTVENPMPSHAKPGVAAPVAAPAPWTRKW